MTKKKISYEGKSQGVSIRLAKGLSYRVGSSQGNRVVNEEEEYICSGIFLISNAGIYFKGTSKSFKIRYNKITSFDWIHNGISITKEGENSLPMFFSFQNEKIAGKLYTLLLKIISDN